MVTYPYVSPLAFERLTVLTQAIKYCLAERLVRLVNPRFVPFFDRDAIQVSLLGLHYERVFAAIPVEKQPYPFVGVDNPFCSEDGMTITPLEEESHIEYDDTSEQLGPWS